MFHRFVVRNELKSVSIINSDYNNTVIYVGDGDGGDGVKQCRDDCYLEEELAH